MNSGDEIGLRNYFNGGGMLGNLPSNFGIVARRLELGCVIDSSGNPHAEEDVLADALDRNRTARDTYRRLVSIGPTHARVLELVIGTDPPPRFPHAVARWGRMTPLVLALAEKPEAVESACLRLALGTSANLLIDKGVAIGAGKAAAEAYRLATAAWSSSESGCQKAQVGA